MSVVSSGSLRCLKYLPIEQVTPLFFSISFYGTGINWITLSFGDLCVKIFVALIMLIPFRISIAYIQEISKVEKKISV